MKPKIFAPSRKISITAPQIHPYLCMLNDGRRNQFYYDAIHATAKDKVVLDVGAGTGILSAYALHAGAKFVFAVEYDDASAYMAHYVLSKCFDQSRFKVIYCDFWSDDVVKHIDREVDLLISETVGPELFDQGMCSTWERAKSFLSKNAISIPDRLHCDVHIWEGVRNIPRRGPWRHEEHGDTLYPEKILMDEFAAALIDFNQNRELNNKVAWGEKLNLSNFNLYDMPPDIIRTDVINITKDTLPEMVIERGIPITSNIMFSLEIDTPKTIAIINKISFLDKTLYLQTALYSPWKYSPSLDCEIPGTYNFIFDKQFKHGWRYNINLKD